MPDGYTQTLLRVNLGSKEVKKEQLKEKDLRHFIGGTGFSMSILYNECSPGYDALNPRTPLILMSAPLVGTKTPGGNQIAVVSKSPLTGLVGFGRSHGFFSPEMKFAGYDGIIITGKSESPVYLWINDEKVKIKKAEHIWGKDTYETEEILKEELGDSKIRVMCIGQAGEVKAKLSCVMNDHGHAAGRCGMGAVMGSKKLKAVAIRGTGEVPVANADKVTELATKWRHISREEHAAKVMSEYGTAGDYDVTESRNLPGDLPTRNWTSSQFEDWKKLSGEYIRSEFEAKKTTCFNCHIGHDYIITIPSGLNKGEYVGPEYETTAALGCNLGNSNTEDIIRLGDLANRFGLDIIEFSNTVSLVMEAYERGVLKKKELDGLEPNWGNMEAVEEFMKKIVQREGIGDILGRGAKEAGHLLGIPSLAVHIKGLSPVLHDLRHHWGWMISYTIAAAGPTHEGIAALDPIENFTTKGIGTAAKNQQIIWWGHDLLGVCWHASTAVPAELVFSFLSPVTGWDTTIEHFKQDVERCITLARAFNIRQGLTPSEDWASEKLLKAPANGPAQGIAPKETLKAMVQDYYEAMGWDPKTGKPWKDTLLRLGLENVAKDLWE